MRGAVGHRRTAIRTTEARGERAETSQSDKQADLSNGAVGRTKERGCPLQPTGEQVLVGRLTKDSAELATEVSRREMNGSSKRGDVQLVGVAHVDQILRPQKVAGGRQGGHRQILAGSAVAGSDRSPCLHLCPQ